jgi:hypothetical protein
MPIWMCNVFGNFNRLGVKSPFAKKLINFRKQCKKCLFLVPKDQGHPHELLMSHIASLRAWPFLVVASFHHFRRSYLTFAAISNYHVYKNLQVSGSSFYRENVLLTFSNLGTRLHAVVPIAV